MVAGPMRLRRGHPPRCSITADIPLRSIAWRIRRICRRPHPDDIR